MSVSPFGKTSDNVWFSKITSFSYEKAPEIGAYRLLVWYKIRIVDAIIVVFLIIFVPAPIKATLEL